MTNNIVYMVGSGVNSDQCYTTSRQVGVLLFTSFLDYLYDNCFGVSETIKTRLKLYVSLYLRLTISM